MQITQKLYDSIPGARLWVHSGKLILSDPTSGTLITQELAEPPQEGAYTLIFEELYPSTASPAPQIPELEGSAALLSRKDMAVILKEMRGRVTADQNDPYEYMTGVLYDAGVLVATNRYILRRWESTTERKSPDSFTLPLLGVPGLVPEECSVIAGDTVTVYRYPGYSVYARSIASGPLLWHKANPRWALPCVAEISSAYLRNSIAPFADELKLYAKHATGGEHSFIYTDKPTREPDREIDGLIMPQLGSEDAPLISTALLLDLIPAKTKKVILAWEEADKAVMVWLQ